MSKENLFYSAEVLQESLRKIVKLNLEKFPIITCSKNIIGEITEEFYDNVVSISEIDKQSLMDNFRLLVFKTGLEQLAFGLNEAIKYYMIIVSYYPENNSPEILDVLIDATKNVNVLIKNFNLFFQLPDEYLSIYETSQPTGTRVSE